MKPLLQQRERKVFVKVMNEKFREKESLFMKGKRGECVKKYKGVRIVVLHVKMPKKSALVWG
jgi:hypothetical protein